MVAPARKRLVVYQALLLAATALGSFAQNALPVLDPPVSADRVVPTIPVGKVLLMPLTASDANGDALTYTVKSSNARILARVKTGNPFLKFAVDHADGGAGDPAYAGELVFMLLRDWTPITSRFIGGFAQSGFYDGTVFHRLTSLGADPTGFIFQGGDPLGTGLGGPGMTGNDPATAWKFQNEFEPALMFLGRGQLAMANSGTRDPSNENFGGPFDYFDTNGSQFFITDGQPRHLDFNHTVFAQLVRGWDLLPKLKATQTTSSAPDVDVTLTGASVQPISGLNQSDAVLVLSAIGAAQSTITVTVDDGKGGKNTRTFVATAVKDTINAPAFFRPVAPVIAARDNPATFPLQMVDLEFDFLDPVHGLLLGDSLKASLARTGGTLASVQPNSGYEGLLRMGFQLYSFDVAAQSFSDVQDATNAFIGIGDREVRQEPLSIEGAPGVAFTGVVARLQDLDPAGAPANFTATINWGDGTVLDTASVARDTSGSNVSVITFGGTHTYLRAGVYPIVVSFIGSKGVTGNLRNEAVISAGAIRAIGRQLELTGASVTNQILATFSDTEGVGVPGAYLASIDWGDGTLGKGVISRGGGGTMVVRGTHKYRDSERYSIGVRIHRVAEATTANDAFAWASANLKFTTTPHLPPFPQPRVTAAWLPINAPPQITKTSTGLPGPNQQVNLIGTYIIINSGNRAIPQAIFRYWLSDDTTLNAPSTTPDKQLEVKLASSNTFVRQLFLGRFAPDASTGGIGLTLKLPKGVSGGRKYLLSEIVYGDALTDGQASPKVFANGPLIGSIVAVPSSGLVTTETGGAANFQVALDTQPVLPTANIASIVAGNPVTIHTASAHGLATGRVALISGVVGSTPEINGARTVTVVDADTFTVPVEVTVAGAGGKVEGTVAVPVESSAVAEGTVNPSQLIFTTTNWNVSQTVTVTGVDDAVDDGNKPYQVRLKAVISSDAIYHGIDPGDVSLSNTDND
jgi:cyclophilin family peptidyl-prolyl cis-trans isomerase